MAHHASSGLVRNPPPALSSPSALMTEKHWTKETINTYLSSRLTFIQFRIALFALDAAFYLTNFRGWFTLARKQVSELVWGPTLGAGVIGRSGRFEDVLEDKLRDMGMSHPNQARYQCLPTDLSLLPWNYSEDKSWRGDSR